MKVTHLKAMFFENRRKYSKGLTQDLRSGELIHLLFAEASSKMVSLEVWLSRSHVYREEVRKVKKCLLFSHP